ncbi:MAG: RNase adapter RapZ [Clostridia bacterium]|nr:RNase adapter RapZ [Clostridia bacterium]
MQYTIITGMSGSGKTAVLRYLEDMGYFCIDNMPPALIPKFADMLSTTNGSFNKVVLVADSRLGEMINELISQVKILRDRGYDCNVMFLDCDDATLVRRYKESRRAHPLNNPDGLIASITQERQMLKKLYTFADMIIDTSNLSSQDLLNSIKSIYGKENEEYELKITVMAFGFKYGVPADADLVFDVRCFPNPFYVDELKHKTGNDKEVQDYVMSSSSAVKFMDKIYDLMDFLIPLYIEEGKSSLTVAIGCTGGKHRSVTMTNKLSEHLTNNHYHVHTVCRDLGKE